MIESLRPNPNANPLISPDRQTADTAVDKPGKTVNGAFLKPKAPSPTRAHGPAPIKRTAQPEHSKQAAQIQPALALPENTIVPSTGRVQWSGQGMLFVVSDSHSKVTLYFHATQVNSESLDHFMAGVKGFASYPLSLTAISVNKNYLIWAQDYLYKYRGISIETKLDEGPRTDKDTLIVPNSVNRIIEVNEATIGLHYSMKGLVIPTITAPNV
jgi:hypothetical protein